MRELSNADLVAGAEAWQAMLIARVTLLVQEIQHLKNENEALRLSLPPHPLTPAAPVLERVVTGIETDLEPE
jgi:hypothetical protein